MKEIDTDHMLAWLSRELEPMYLFFLLFFLLFLLSSFSSFSSSIFFSLLYFFFLFLLFSLFLLLSLLYFFISSCEADPEVLAKYVHALLKHDSDHKDLKSHCVNELRDFLRDYTEDFVDSLFEAIESN